MRNAHSCRIRLHRDRGPCLDAAECGMNERFSNKTAIAPTASISIICGGTSPGIEPIAGNSFTHKTLSGSFNVRNRHLDKLLDEKGQNNDDVWSSIVTSGGSVQHLDFLSDDEKAVFKTAFELDQRWLIDFAGDRSELIDQAQSLNVFLPAGRNTFRDCAWSISSERSPAKSISQRWSNSKAVLNTAFSSSLKKSRCCTEPPEVTMDDQTSSLF